MIWMLEDPCSRAQIERSFSLFDGMEQLQFAHACAQAWAVMPILNEMVHSVSEDEEFLKSTLTLASEYDEFTANLLRTYNLTKNARDNRRELSVGVHRSDYMFDEPSGRLLQVSVRTPTMTGSYLCMERRSFSFAQTF